MPLTSLKSGLSMQPACHLEDGTTNARPGFIVNVASFLFAAVYLLSSFGEPTNGSELNSGRLEQRSHRHQPAPTTQAPWVALTITRGILRLWVRSRAGHKPAHLALCQVVPGWPGQKQQTATVVLEGWVSTSTSHDLSACHASKHLSSNKRGAACTDSDRDLMTSRSAGFTS